MAKVAVCHKPINDSKNISRNPQQHFFFTHSDVWAFKTDGAKRRAGVVHSPGRAPANCTKPNMTKKQTPAESKMSI